MPSSDLATALLRDMRAQGMTPGTQLPAERELMAHLRAGRSTIREAINGLAILGAIEIRPGHGTFVLDPTAGLGRPHALGDALARGTTRDLFEAARLLEAHTTGVAAARCTAKDLGDLGVVLGDHTCAVRDRHAVTTHVARFHARLAAAAGNELLARTVEHIVGVLLTPRRALGQLAAYGEWELCEHRTLLGAVADGDPDRAAARMASHVDALQEWCARPAAPITSRDERTADQQVI